jgi:hypothetical protein
MTKSFKMDHQNFWELEYWQLFLNVYFLFAAFAFESTASQLFHFHELIQTITQFDCLAKLLEITWNLNWKVHEVVKGICTVATTQTLKLTYKLALKQVSHYRVISFLVVVDPFSWLVLETVIFKVNLFILWFN